MQPGMPQGFGVVGPDATPIITLPGNPVSAYVSFEVFVRAALEAMLVTGELRLPVRRAVLSGPAEGAARPPGRTCAACWTPPGKRWPRWVIRDRTSSPRWAGRTRSSSSLSRSLPWPRATRST